MNLIKQTHRALRPVLPAMLLFAWPLSGCVTTAQRVNPFLDGKTGCRVSTVSWVTQDATGDTFIVGSRDGFCFCATGALAPGCQAGGWLEPSVWSETGVAAPARSSEVTDTLGKKLRPLLECTRQTSSGDPELHGALQIRFDVSPFGMASGAHVVRNAPGSPLAKCLIGVLERAQFPEREKAGEFVLIPFLP